jgi:hexosaminidase
MNKVKAIPLQVLLSVMSIAVFITVLPCAAQTEFVNTLMPQPQKLIVQAGQFTLTSSFNVKTNGNANPLLHNATERLLATLQEKSGVQLLPHGSGSGANGLLIHVADSSGLRPILGTDEKYTLRIDSDGIQLNAQNVFGAMDGMETLFQLLQETEAGSFFPAVEIDDAPRFPWRGLMLDPGRHFLSVDTILRTLDGMAAAKLNVLHWHLSDDQGFRVQSKVFPWLAVAGSNGRFYTQEQVKQVIVYASERGIRVLPEFDVPSHTTSWMVGYPMLGSRKGEYTLATTNGIKDSVMDPTRESTYQFLDSFFAEMAELFPDEYLHVGGDENNGKDWQANRHIARFMREHRLTDKNGLQAYFNHRVEAILLRHHRRMVGWDEILHPELAPDVVIQNWHGTEFLIDAAKQGHQGLLSKVFYLDHMYTSADMYAADPIPSGSDLTPAQAKLVLGGEACMWGEQVSDAIIDSRIWPRAAAVGERLWSSATTRDANDMYRRLAFMSLRLDALGVRNISGPQRGLRQLAGVNASEQAALAVFDSVLQPVDFHERAREQHTAESTPIGRLVDYSVPDPPSRRDLAAMVNARLQARDDTERAAASAA